MRWIVAGWVGLGMWAQAGMAEVPKVAADIGPVHALVAQVMGDLGTPAQIVPPGASPHGHAMKPSEAAALEQAGLVVMVGHALTPWLDGPVETLSGDAVVLELLEAEGTTLLPAREKAVFSLAGEAGHEAHDHDEAHDHEKADEEHDAHGHEEAHDDDHADMDGQDDHDHGSEDPHAWLDPENGKVWLGVIAEALAGIDPDNAAIYSANAGAGQAAIDAAMADVETRLAPVRGRSFIAFHDAYQYFEHRFDIPSAGAIRLGDASDPSPARIVELRALLADKGATCILTEPQFDPDLATAVSEGNDMTHGVIDPLGTDLPQGATLYPALMRKIASAIADCL